MKHALTCAAALLAVALSAHAGPQEQLTEILIDASEGANPSVSFFQGLGRIGTAQVNQAQVKAAIAAAEEQGLAVNPTLKSMLNNVNALRIENGRDVRIRMSKETSVDLAGKGWAHLKQDVRFRVSPSGDRLDKFKGFKLGKSKNGMSITPNSIVFSTRGDGTPIATIDLGLFVGKKVIELKRGTKKAELQGITSTLSQG